MDDGAVPLKLYNEITLQTIDVLEEKPEVLDLPSYYEIDETVKFLTQNNFQRVALQFPDNLLSDSALIVSYLKESKPGIDFYILGDTSYGSECVDEVAAEHVAADCLIHYGQATLTATARLPVLYVFGRGTIDVQDCVKQFSSKFNEDDEVVIFYDCTFHHAISEFQQETMKTKPYKNLHFTQMNKQGLVNKQKPRECASSCSSTCSKTPEDQQQCSTPELPPTTNFETPSESANLNFNFSGRFLDKPLEIKSQTIFYIGSDENVVLVNLMMSFSQAPVWKYNPKLKELRKETVSVNRQLQRRFFLIEKAKTANIFGILIGTLAMANYLDLLHYLKKVINGSGKKYYTFVVGKLNVAKLANFSEIDMFVLIAGPESSLIDSKEYYRPIITPFELEIALVKGKTWDNCYTTDFHVVLKNQTQFKEEDEEDQQETRVSLVTGKVVANPKAHVVVSTSESRDLVLKANSSIVEYSAAKLFLEKLTRLEQKIGETPVVLAIEGLSGLPFTGYEGEGERVGKDLSYDSLIRKPDEVKKQKPTKTTSNEDESEGGDESSEDLGSLLG